MSNLSSLTTLDISGNSIGDAGALALSKLSCLTTLDIGTNSIGEAGARAILETWADRPTLTRLRLRGNGDLSAIMPVEVFQTSDAQAILAAYREHRAAKAANTLVELREAKVLIVGKAFVGKTSLANYLVDGKHRDGTEQETEGIQIRDSVAVTGWHPAAWPDLRLNFWDFGGQEMLHGTHRFFLTERSLYLVVLSARCEDDDISAHDWIRTIRSRAGNAPVIVIINWCDRPDLVPTNELEAKLRGEFRENLVRVVRTSCNSGDHAKNSIEALQRLIVETVQDDPRMAHVRNGVTPAFQRVRREVAALAKREKVLTYQRFVQICADGAEDERMTDTNLQRSTLQVLNDLGAVVAQGLTRDASAARREMSVLDPNWLTNAIYKFIRMGNIVAEQGFFTRAEMPKVLNDHNAYPPDRHELILDNMMEEEVGLCLRLADGRYLVPEALPKWNLDTRDWPEDSLEFLYEYLTLPEGLIPRMIVKAEDKLLPRSICKTGAVFFAHECRILLVGDRGQGRIRIRVAGPHNRRRDALSAIRTDLEYVHRLKPEVGAVAYVPVKGDDQSEGKVPYNDLIAWEAEHGPEFKFPVSGIKGLFTVAQLLNGVRMERNFEYERGATKGEFHIHNSVVNLAGGDIADNTQRAGEGNDCPATPQPPPPAPPAPQQWRQTRWASGILIALAAAGIAFIIAILLRVPWNHAAVAAIAASVMAFIYWIRTDPVSRYYRMAYFILGGWFALQVFGGTFFAKAESALPNWLNAAISWDSSVGIGVHIVVGLVFLTCVAADLITRSKP